LLAATTAAAAAVSMSASSTMRDRDMATRPITGSSTTSPIVSTSKVALDGGEDGLAAYRAIASEAKRLLAPGGRLFVELGLGQEEAVRALFTNAGLIVGIARKDLAGIPRVLGVGLAS
jgi:methylase of polypeptide subunit release factors